jgi:hypothetical protein
VHPWKHSFRRLTLRSATGTAQRAHPYRHEGSVRMRPVLRSLDFPASVNYIDARMLVRIIKTVQSALSASGHRIFLV